MISQSRSTRGRNSRASRAHSSQGPGRYLLKYPLKYRLLEATVEIPLGEMPLGCSALCNSEGSNQEVSCALKSSTVTGCDVA